MPRMNAQQMFDAVKQHAGVKCRRDAAAVIAACRDDFVLDVPELGIRVAGRTTVLAARTTVGA